jgi:two-component system chemotaxis sensor kinase CheA
VDTRDFLDIFLTESREHLEGLNALLTRCRQQSLEQEEINELFRHAHSLKGMASTMGYRPITRLAHAMEDIFHGWRDDGLAPSAELLERLLRSTDRLAAQIDAIADGGDPPDEPDLVESLCGPITPPAADGDAAGAERAPDSPPAAEDNGQGATPADGGPASPSTTAPDSRPRLSIEIRLRPETPLPAARGLVVLKELSGMGTVLGCTPPAEEIVPGLFTGHLVVSLASGVPAETIARSIRELADVELCRIEPEAAADRRQAARRQLAERRGPSLASGEKGPDAGGPRPDAVSTIRVATDRMDRLLDGVGELILDRERLKLAVSAASGSPQAGILEGLGRTIDALRDEVMAMRLIPFSSIAPRLERTVRDLCHRLGKKVDLVVAGTDVAIDRSILEELMDPLQHVLRNSIDHGIEAPEARQAVGKSEAGRIEIGLTRREERVTLTVEDDGSGIDPAAVRRVAVERRFISREAAEVLSDEESFQLITMPGFSTAHRTTEISGRGVGMDVVQTQVRKLGGRLHIRSHVGRGTRFEMDLPLTVTVTRAFLCRAGGEVYAVPVSIVQQTLELQGDRLQGSRGERLVRREDEILTVLPLAGLLADASEVLYPSVFPALVYRIGHKAYALAVDEILGEEEIVIKPLKHPLELLPQYSGAAILNDGRIALILDPTNLVHVSRAA